LRPRFSPTFAGPVDGAASSYSRNGAEAFEGDAFRRFEREGVFNAKVGADFVERILSKSNAAGSAELFRAFMDRDPDPQALLVRAGL
jgi:oligopeptidase A